MRYLLILFFLSQLMVDALGEVVNAQPADSCFPEVYRLIEDRSYDEAIMLLETVIPSLTIPDHVGEAYFSLAYSHDQLGRPLKAIGFYLKASGHYEKKQCVSNTFENIGLIYKRFNQHDKAIFYLRDRKSVV